MCQFLVSGYTLCTRDINLFVFTCVCGMQVLRLWLERKIFPESVLRRYMDEMTVSCSFRRPSRAERSLDDPIRELEDMFVDEYGRCEFFCFIVLIRLAAHVLCLISLLCNVFFLRVSCYF